MKKPLPAGYPAYCAGCPNYRPNNKLIDRCIVFANHYEGKNGVTRARWNPTLDASGKCRACGIVNGNRPVPPQGE